jgi:hypothetical protein
MAFATLPNIQDIDPMPLVFDVWVWATPLWGNPFLLNPQGIGLEVSCHILACHGNVSMIASLYHAVMGAREVLAMVGGGLPVRMYGGVWQTLLLGGLVGTMPPLDSPLCTFPKGPQLILEAFSLLPPMWREYCDSHPCPPLDNLDTQSRDTEFMLLRRLGWIKNTKKNINLLTLTVKQATWLGTKNNRLYLMDHHRSFHIAAFQDPPSRLVFDTTFAAFPATLRRLWIIPWENSHKEAYWRLALDAFAMVGNSHMGGDVPPCACSPIVISPRLHYFWECTIARALVTMLSEISGYPVLRQHLWLAIPPNDLIWGRVWDVVCLAAMSSLREGWVFMSTHRLNANIDLGIAMVTATFWSRLSCFTSLGSTVLRFWSELPQDQPFFAWRDGGLVVVRP